MYVRVCVYVCVGGSWVLEKPQMYSGGSRGRALLPRQNFFYFMQFSGQICQIICWLTPRDWGSHGKFCIRHWQKCRSNQGLWLALVRLPLDVFVFYHTNCSCYFFQIFLQKLKMLILYLFIFIYIYFSLNIYFFNVFIFFCFFIITGTSEAVITSSPSPYHRYSGSAPRSYSEGETSGNRICWSISIVTHLSKSPMQWRHQRPEKREAQLQRNLN